jgi:UDP-glucose 4-epimerase
LPEHLRGIADIEVTADYASKEMFNIIDEHTPLAIIHCAGSSLVGPSVKDPGPYYENNFVKTKNLVDFIVQKHPTTRLIFSSSSSVYGEPVMVPCREEDPPLPLSPYGESKYMIEMLLNAYANAHGLNFVAFRYFNVCGADSRGRHGQAPKATHIIARILESIRDNKTFTIYGTDYPTEDGTCVRDHVHVEDVSRLHLLATSPEFAGGIYNVGCEHGASNKQIAERAQAITGKTLDLQFGDRRPGDPSHLLAYAGKVKTQGWEPRYTLDDMIRHAWNWYTK